MSRKKTHVKVGDEVAVIAGNHKGKSGKVVSVNAKKDTAVVEGVRVIKKTMRRSEENPDGGIESVDGPIHLSNLKKVS